MSCFLPLIVSYAIVSDTLGHIKGINRNGNQLSIVEQTLGNLNTRLRTLIIGSGVHYGFYNLIQTQPMVGIAITILNRVVGTMQGK